MRFLAGVMLGIFSAVLILVQALFVTWNTAYPQILFYIVTIVSVILTVVMFVKGDKK